VSGNHPTREARAEFERFAWPDLGNVRIVLSCDDRQSDYLDAAGMDVPGGARVNVTPARRQDRAGRGGAILL